MWRPAKSGFYLELTGRDIIESYLCRAAGIRPIDVQPRASYWLRKTQLSNTWHDSSRTRWRVEILLACLPRRAFTANEGLY